jgi:hypothetical protein
MSDTPETDDLARGNHVVPTELAEQLERERDEARGHLENHTASTIHSCHDQCKRPMCVLRRERDEARKDAKEIQKLRDNIQRIKEWLNLTDSGLRLRCGELTAQEIRTVRSVLKSIIRNE